MSAKICPECKFANKARSKTCKQCGFEFPPVTEPPPDRSQEEAKWIRPEQAVECPHCKNETVVLGGTKTDTMLTSVMRKTPIPSSTFPKFRCRNCHRDFLYHGPYKIECQECCANIALHWDSWKDVASCPECSQRYRLAIVPRERVATQICCEICCPCLW